jgi:hypothetical protein
VHLELIEAVGLDHRAAFSTGKNQYFTGQGPAFQVVTLFDDRSRGRIDEVEADIVFRDEYLPGGGPFRDSTAIKTVTAHYSIFSFPCGPHTGFYFPDHEPDSEYFRRTAGRKVD